MLLESRSVGSLLEVLSANLADDGLGCFVLLEALASVEANMEKIDSVGVEGYRRTAFSCEVGPDF